MNATKNKISNYRFKLEQANYHFSNMKKNVNPLKREFAFELCAFVESARNVTLAMQKELAKVKGFDEWYTIKVKEMQGDELFRFFNEKRVKVVHHGDIGYEGHSFYVKGKFSADHDKIIIVAGVKMVYENNSIIIKVVTSEGEEYNLETVESVVTPIFKNLNNRHVTEGCAEYLHNLDVLVREAERNFPNCVASA